MSLIGDRLREAMEVRGVSQPELADAVGCTQGAVSQILTGSTQRSRFLADMADYLNVPVSWLKGEGSNDVPLPEATIKARALTHHEQRFLELLADASPDRQHAVLSYLTPGSTDTDDTLEQQKAADTLDLVPIAEIDLAYGMGGTFTDYPVELTMHHFPRIWVESISRAPPSMLTIARGRGDSMVPTIHDGDMIVINRAERIIREQDAIWALTVGDIGMVKRVRVRGEKVVILSDNERVPADEYHVSEVNIVGRIDFIGSRK